MKHFVTNTVTCIIIRYTFLYRMQKLTVLVLAAVVGACVAYDPHYSFFHETSLLNCMVPNPRRGLRDQPDTKVEEIPVAQFHIVYNESGYSYFAPISLYVNYFTISLALCKHVT